MDVVSDETDWVVPQSVQPLQPMLVAHLIHFRMNMDDYRYCITCTDSSSITTSFRGPIDGGLPESNQISSQWISIDLKILDNIDHEVDDVKGLLIVLKENNGMNFPDEVHAATHAFVTDFEERKLLCCMMDYNEICLAVEIDQKRQKLTIKIKYAI